MLLIDRTSRFGSARARGNSPRNSQNAHRQAFTLIELLIVVAILLLLTTFVVSIYNTNAGGDKMRSAARSAQSAFLGARDRALHAFSTTKIASPANRRGIRLIRDQQDPSLITGFAYLQPIDVQPPLQYGFPVTNGELQVELVGGQATRVRGIGVDWDTLYNNGIFPFPGRIKIPADTTGEWYTFTGAVTAVPMTNPKQVVIDVTTPISTGAILPTDPRATCEFDLGVEFLPNHQPIALPAGVVIDLEWSALPALWRQTLSISSASPIPAGWVNIGNDTSIPGNILIALANLDVMFSPRGTVTGAVAGTGPICFLLNTIEDATQNLSPVDPLNKGEKLVLALFPQTGHVQTYPIDPTDVLDNATGNPVANGDGKADDLFRFVKQGSAAGQ